jgi:hypothetical protein
MKAIALKKFTASINGCGFECDEGDEIESEAKNLAKLEAVGLVTTKQAKRPSKARKAEEND